MATEGLDLQKEWDGDAVVAGGWPVHADSRFVYQRLQELPSAVTARDAAGRVLEVAAAEAVHSCKLNLRGLETVVLEPSPRMLAVARGRMAEYGAHLTFVRGVAERLPFRDGTFDRVLCESSIDHFAAPDLGVREMARVCKPDGRVVIGVVNYGSLSVRLSRLAYRVARRTGRWPASRRQFWDSPVPFDHTFECTHRELMRLGSRYCDLEDVLGVSLGWALPGWGAVLERLSDERATMILRRLDAIARRVPRWADYLLTVWRPRPRATWHLAADGSALRVEAHDPAYRWKIQHEAATWARVPPLASAPPPAVISLSNAGLTGDPTRSWMADLAARGPFRHTAVLGIDDDDSPAHWLRAGASEDLEVYELSRGAIRRSRTGLPRGVRFVHMDLNFARLPTERYDLVWTSGTLHHIVNLEHLLDEVARALRPGGLFALHDYVGETRHQYHPDRLARMNAALAGVPLRFRHGGIDAIAPAVFGHTRGAFCGVRSAEVLAAARARFDVVHEGRAGALYPLFLYVDLPALLTEAPATLDRLIAAEQEALREPAIAPCVAYAVFRRR